MGRRREVAPDSPVLPTQGPLMAADSQKVRNNRSPRKQDLKMKRSLANLMMATVVAAVVTVTALPASAAPSDPNSTRKGSTVSGSSLNGFSLNGSSTDGFSLN